MYVRPLFWNFCVTPRKTFLSFVLEQQRIFSARRQLVSHSNPIDRIVGQISDKNELVSTFLLYQNDSSKKVQPLLYEEVVVRNRKDVPCFFTHRCTTSWRQAMPHFLNCQSRPKQWKVWGLKKFFSGPASFDSWCPAIADTERRHKSDISTSASPLPPKELAVTIRNCLIFYQVIHGSP